MLLVEERVRSKLPAKVTEPVCAGTESSFRFHHMAGDELAVSDHEQEGVGRRKDTGSGG